MATPRACCAATIRRSAPRRRCPSSKGLRRAMPHATVTHVPFAPSITDGDPVPASALRHARRPAGPAGRVLQRGCRRRLRARARGHAHRVAPRVERGVAARGRRAAQGGLDRVPGAAGKRQLPHRHDGGEGRGRHRRRGRAPDPAARLGRAGEPHRRGAGEGPPLPAAARGRGRRRGAGPALETCRHRPRRRTEGRGGAGRRGGGCRGADLRHRGRGDAAGDRRFLRRRPHDARPAGRPAQAARKCAGARQAAGRGADERRPAGPRAGPRRTRPRSSRPGTPGRRAGRPSARCSRAGPTRAGGCR